MLHQSIRFPYLSVAALGFALVTGCQGPDTGAGPDDVVDGDALLATNFLPPPTRSDAVVLVVHDLAFEVMPEAGPGFGERWRRRFDGWLRRSAGVIVPSASITLSPTDNSSTSGS